MRLSPFVFSFALCLAGSAIVLSRPCSGLNVLSRDAASLNLAGSLAAGGGVADYHGFGPTAGDGDGGEWFGDLRLLADANLGRGLSLVMNILQTARSASVTVPAGTESPPVDVERSGLLYWQQHDSANTRAAMVVDSAYLELGGSANELRIGRQPVATTVTFFFTPNDFFTPFSPNTFYRVYRPGIDAVRYERRLAELSQLSVIGVLGYSRDPAEESGWRASPEWNRSSVLARATHTAGAWEWGGLGGIVREAEVAGFSLQGELFQWLGIRTEGHYAHSRVGNADSALILTLGFEHRFSGSLTLRLEQMYNGYGADSFSAALADTTPGILAQGYHGRHYSALDLSYEISPLLTGEMLYLRNWTDGSYTVSFNVVYSLSDESELSFTSVLPGGPESEGGIIRSELGSLPVRFALEYRLYF